MSYEIFTDSTTDLPAKLAEELGLHVIPFIYTLDGKDYHNYLDYREQSVKEFYDALRSGKTGTTTQVTTHRYMEAWRPALEAGKDVFYMCLSSLMSKSFEQCQMAASEAAEEFPERRVVVLDSKSASLGQGLLAVKAAKARDAGKTLDEIAAYIEGEITHTHFWIMADDLHHLKRGGRISGTKAVIGTMLNVKPILTIANTGKLMPFTKARGRNKALTMFMEQMDKYKCRKGETVYIAHSDVPEAAEQLKELLAERGETDIIVNTIGPVIGAHTGPGTIAIVFSGDGERELEQ